jgi:anti-sigma regulatory factor (Ser/Thr protein kinase)
MAESRRTHVPAVASAPRAVADALDAFCQAEALPDAVCWRLRVALDEIVANIVAYGGANRSIDVSFRRSPDRAEVVVIDDGVPFDPLARMPPDVTSPLEARSPGGLGIALVKSLMDGVHYQRTDRNVLTVWTDLPGRDER